MRAVRAPVSITRTCGHIRCVNSRALELAGITRNTPDPVGGEIERDASGEPTGVLKETARDLVLPFIPKGDLRGKSAELGGSWQSVEISGNSGCM